MPINKFIDNLVKKYWDISYDDFLEEISVYCKTNKIKDKRKQDMIAYSVFDKIKIPIIYC